MRLSTLVVLLAPAAFAQQRFTSADYAQAEKFMTYNTTPLVLRSGVRPTWIENDRFWYRVTTAEGSEFILIDPATAARRPAFDHAKLAADLTAASGTKYDAAHLPFTDIELNGTAVSFNIGRERWTCAEKCSAVQSSERGGRGGRGGAQRNDVPSPDKARTVFIRDFNL